MGTPISSASIFAPWPMGQWGMWSTPTIGHQKWSDAARKAMFTRSMSHMWRMATSTADVRKKANMAR